MMASSIAAKLLVGGVPITDSRRATIEAKEILARYLKSGFRAFLFPAKLATEGELLASLCRLARELAAQSGEGRVLLALGGHPGPGFGIPNLRGIPSPLGLAALGSKSLANRSGRLLGLELAQAGIDVLLGPSLDLAPDPKAGDGVVDSFGDSPALVASLGLAWVRGLRSAGVEACPGRFPGLGAATGRKGEIPSVNIPADLLDKREMLPFKRIFSSGCASVLVGRAFIPAFEDGNLPAARSAQIVEGRLRSTMGFGGLAVAEDLGPEAMPGKAAIQGVLAGCDLIVASEPEMALKVAYELGEAADSGELNRLRFEAALSRVNRFCGRLPNRRAKKGSGGIGALSRRMLGRATGRGEEFAITIVRGGSELPLESDGLTTLVFLPGPGSMEEEEGEFALDVLTMELPGSSLLAFPADPTPAESVEFAQRIVAEVEGGSCLVLSHDAHLHPSQEALIRLAQELSGKFVLGAMRNPHDASFFPKAACLLAAYGFSALTCRAVARVALGKAAARGHCPVAILGIKD